MDLQMDMSSLLAKLDQCRQQVAAQGKRKALWAGGVVIRDAMSEAAPVLPEKHGPNSTSLEPGALKAGMRVLLEDNGAEPEALVGPSAKVEHAARWVEYGHRMVVGGYSKVDAKGGTRGPGKALEAEVPPHSFLRSAFEASVEAALVAERESIAETIQEAVR